MMTPAKDPKTQRLLNLWNAYTTASRAEPEFKSLVDQDQIQEIESQLMERGVFAPEHKLSAKQRAILLYIQRYYIEHGIAPTRTEVEENVPNPIDGSTPYITSTSVAAYNIDRLVEMGFLEKIPRVGRGLKIVQWIEDDLD